MNGRVNVEDKPEIEELQRSVRTIHDLERAIRHWELLRDNAQRLVNETMAYSENAGDSFESTLELQKRGLISTVAMRGFFRRGRESTNCKRGLRNAMSCIARFAFGFACSLGCHSALQRNRKAENTLKALHSYPLKAARS